MTSAYIVRKVEGNWLDFQLPSIFVGTTIIILMSSVTMQWAYSLVRKDDLNKAKIAIGLTLVLGILFLVGQVMGWSALVGTDVYLVGNPAGSFLYVLTGLHSLHLVAGLVFLLIAFMGIVKYKIHSRNIVTIEMCVTFWHFLGGLWLYLYIFLLLNR
jgi:cytochrome c oxidase subunit 3